MNPFAQRLPKLPPTITADTPLNRYHVDLNRYLANESRGLPFDAGWSLKFVVPAARIYGDMSNATVAKRVGIQTSVANGQTGLSVLPNGTSTTAGINCFNGSNPDAAGYGYITAFSTRIAFGSSNVGGTTQGIGLQIDGVDCIIVNTNKDVQVGQSGATAMVAGFPFIPSGAGAPTGVPTAYAGFVPLYYDRTNNKLYVYNGAWKQVLLT